MVCHTIAAERPCTISILYLYCLCEVGQCIVLGNHAVLLGRQFVYRPACSSDSSHSITLEGTLKARRQTTKEQWHNRYHSKAVAASLQVSITQIFQPDGWLWSFPFSMTWTFSVPSFPWKPRVMGTCFYVASTLPSIPDGKGAWEV